MRFNIYTMNDSSGVTYSNKEDFLQELSQMIDDCISSGCSLFNVEVDTNANCSTYDKENNKWHKTPWGKRVM